MAFAIVASCLGTIISLGRYILLDIKFEWIWLVLTYALFLIWIYIFTIEEEIKFTKKYTERIKLIKK